VEGRGGEVMTGGMTGRREEKTWGEIAGIDRGGAGGWGDSEW
jgi:hypothetical protein